MLFSAFQPKPEILDHLKTWGDANEYCRNDHADYA